VLPRKARGHAATRIAPGICVSAGADADCRQSTELERGALSWGQLLARAESAPPLPRSAGPTEAPPSRTIRSDASHPDPSPVASNLVASNDTADPSHDQAPPARARGRRPQRIEPPITQAPLPTVARMGLRGPD
jgi:hypothetical protein